MTVNQDGNERSANFGNAVGTLVWGVFIFATILATNQQVQEDTAHNPAGVLPAFGTAMLLVILVASVLFVRRLIALVTGMTVTQREALDPWRPDYGAATGFALVLALALIADNLPGVDYVLGGDLTITVLISVMCVHPITELTSRRWLVWQTVKENQGGWINRTKVGAWIIRQISRPVHWWKGLPDTYRPR